MSRRGFLVALVTFGATAIGLGKAFLRPEGVRAAEKDREEEKKEGDREDERDEQEKKEEDDARRKGAEQDGQERPEPETEDDGDEDD